MRITNAQMQFQGTQAILDRFSEVSKTQLQLATGRRINKPSDDPVGASQLLPLQEIVDRHKQFDKNANAVISRLNLEDATLGSATNVLQRIYELAVQGNSDNIGSSDRVSISEELSQQLSELMNLANMQDASGDYMFAGDDVGTLPFTESPAGTFNYNGDSGQRNVQIGATRQIPIGDPGDTVFMNIAFSGGGNQDIFKTIYDFTANMQANTRDPNVLTDLQTAIDSISATRSKIGARLQAIDSTKVINEQLISQSEETLSTIRDLDFAEGVSRLSLQLTGLQASQQAFLKIQDLTLFNFL